MLDVYIYLQLFIPREIHAAQRLKITDGVLCTDFEHVLHVSVALKKHLKLYWATFDHQGAKEQLLKPVST